MNTNAPTHEEVTRRAEEIWSARGRPSGQDEEIWHEAERQLKAASVKNAPSEAQGRGNGNSQASEATTGAGVRPSESSRPAEAASPPPSPAETSAKASQQKKTARAPKLPGKTAPKSPPAETGKPLWDKPHSS